jgi:hypothetical protein
MAPEQYFYNGIQNRTQIIRIFEPYDMAECMSDTEFFGEFVEDLVDDHPNVPNLRIVLERMLVAALEDYGL